VSPIPVDTDDVRRIFGVVRMGAAVAAIPLASALVDRYPRQRVLLAIHVARGSALAVCALVLAMGGVLPLVFVLAGVIPFGGSSTVTRHRRARLV
jgi:CHASE2 domain-containing sensor protein